MLQDEEIQLISEETGFSPALIERLYSRFKSLDKNICGSLSRQDFLRVPELAINPLCDRIVHMFFVDCDEDHDRINFRQFMKVLAAFRSSTRPTRLSQDKYKHSRHSSCDGFFYYYNVPHHTTNQHSIHYVGNNLQGQFKKPHTSPPTLLDPYEPANSRKQKLYFMFKVYDVDNDDRLSLDDLKQILIMMVGNYISDSNLTRLAFKTLRQADRNNDGYIDFDEFCTAFLHRDIDELLRVKFK